MVCELDVSIFTLIATLRRDNLPWLGDFLSKQKEQQAMRAWNIRQVVMAIVGVALSLWIGPVWAQSAASGLGGGQFGSDPLGGFGQTGEPVVVVTAQFTAPTAGQPGRLFVTAQIKPNWHIYSITQPPGGPVATTIRLAPSQQYRVIGEFQTSPPPERKQEPVFDNLVVESHENKVTWHAPLEFAPGVDPATVRIEGNVTAQPCDANSCRPPERFPFVAAIGQGLATADPQATSGAAAPQAGPPPRPLAANAAALEVATPSGPKFDPGQVQTEEAVEATSIGVALLFAFGGGLILNIMPCVLPVIGLKVLAFFNQAGESRGRALALNLWYAMGLISVFLVLAALGVGLSEMFTERLFGIIMSGVVFAMALSLMGVWELQVPSFLGGGRAQAFTEKEGAVGAFFKGIITTLLAIPCGAPLLSPALKWADEQVRAGSPGNVYLAFAVIGLGMASPYLLIGAFPELLRFLPKPGPWMDTFKKAMGYLLLVAVVWILYFLPIEDVVPTIGLLFGLWLACWLIGRLTLTASSQSKSTAWTLALLSIVISGLISFQFLRPAMRHRMAKLAAASIQEGKQDEAVYQRFVALQATSADGMGSNALIGTSPETNVLTSAGGAAAGVPGARVSEAGAGSDDQAELPWLPFNRAVFEQLVAANKTVLVDFTADWCLTCKTLEALVLNTKTTREAVDRNGVVTLQADWTHGAPEVTEMLEILGSKQVPVVAIFPAGDPNRPIVLRGGYTKQTLLEALQKAGPSAGAPAARTAMSPG
jgi:thiol:disulfide interchange protein DsbD